MFMKAGFLKFYIDFQNHYTLPKVVPRHPLLYNNKKYVKKDNRSL